MKKMILLVSMLAGIMTFSGCVDDKESPSVSAVRQAKAAQLTAIAAHENALAAYQQMLTEKDAAIKEAEAALKAAKAAAAEAENEAAKAEAQVRIAKAEAELAALANAVEIANLKAQQDLLTAQAEYDEALADADATKRGALYILYQAYVTATNNLLTAQSDLIINKISLARLQAGLDNEEEVKQIQINQFTNQIADAEEKIAEDEAMIEVYEAQKAPEEAKTELASEKVTLANLNQAVQKASEALTAARETLGTANVNMEGNPWDSEENGQKYYQIASSIISGTIEDNNGNDVSSSNNWIGLYRGYNGIEGEDGKVIPATVDSYYFRAIDKKTSKYTYTKVMSAKTTEDVEKTVTLAPGVEKVESYENIESYFELDPAGVKAYIDSLQANIDAHEGDVLASAKLDVANTQKAISDAEKENPKDQTKIDGLKAQLANETAAVNRAQTSYDNAEAWLASIQDAFKSLEGEATNWQATIEAVNTASEAVCDAEVAADKANYAVKLQQATVNALQAVVDGLVKLPDGSVQQIAVAIKDLQNDIVIKNNLITSYKQSIAQLENGQISTEQQIAQYETWIAQYEAQVQVYEKQVADAKATLDAATAAQGE